MASSRLKRIAAPLCRWESGMGSTSALVSLGITSVSGSFRDPPVLPDLRRTGSCWPGVPGTLAGKQETNGWWEASHRLRPSHGAHREDFVREFGGSRQGLGEHTRSELSHFKYLAFPLARN